MKSKLFRTFVIFGFFYLASCSDEIVSECETGDKQLEVKFSVVQSEVFDKHCAGCHGSSFPQGGLELTAGKAYDNLVGVNAKKDPEFKLVDPGNSLQSYLFKTLTNDGAPLMPTTGALSEEKIDLVKQWIDSGAENN